MTGDILTASTPVRGLKRKRALDRDSVPMGGQDGNITKKTKKVY
jgi:hypothetical protein